LLHKIVSLDAKFSLNAQANYPLLERQKANLFKCFLPQAWQANNLKGVSGFLHPEGIYDEPNGGLLRSVVYPRLRSHFQFNNEKNLFAEVHNNTTFSINIYATTVTSGAAKPRKQCDSERWLSSPWKPECRAGFRLENLQTQSQMLQTN
jgi:hypothetical protein